MKLAGIVGTGVGKLGASVFTVRKGQQVVRQYQPVVSNPNTEEQVRVRAVFSLLTKNAKLLSGAFGFKVSGLETQRNAFIKANYGVSARRPEEGESAALMDYGRVVLSTGLEDAGSIQTFAQDYRASITISGFEKVRGAVIVTNPRGEAPHVLTFEQDVIQDEAMIDYNALQDYIDGDRVQITIAWYGVKFADAGSRARYENLNSVATRSANVAFMRMLSEGSAIASRTKTWQPGA